MNTGEYMHSPLEEAPAVAPEAKPIEHTFENLATLVEELARNSYSCADAFRSDPKRYEHYKTEATALRSVLPLLEDPSYFRDIWNIFLTPDGKPYN